MFNFEKQHPLLVAVDSDGCVFDVMDLKHQECFCPAFIEYYELQTVSRAARECWEFANLRSSTRGTNRFPVIPITLDLLQGHPDVIARGFEVPLAEGLRQWVSKAAAFSGPALEEAASSGDPDLATALAWHRDVNDRIARLVHGVEPIPGARDGLTAAACDADLVVVSQASSDALEREWTQHSLMPLVRAAPGQEVGSKSRQLQQALEGRYEPKQAIMLGDAPGDRKAAEDAGTWFFPIIPYQEPRSWKRFVQEALPRFFSGTFDTSYQEKLLEEFDSALPRTPPWD